MEQDRKFDVVVIGGGAAGMMAAGRAAEAGAKVGLIEKTGKLGQKILITGKGRCNITHDEADNKRLVEAYGKQGRFLFSAFTAFSPRDARDFFEKWGTPTKVERGGRVFPESDKAQDVIRTFLRYFKENDVELILDSEVEEFFMENGKIRKIRLKNSEYVWGKSFIVATGGKSYPQTGSTGDAWEWAEIFGHKAVPARPSLVPIRTREDWARELKGLALKNVELKLYSGGKKVESVFGEMIFTHFGLSGPIAIDISKKVGEILEEGGETSLRLDLKPALDEEKLDARIRRDFEKYGKKRFKNSLADLLPQRLIEVVLKLSGIDPGKKVNEITREERLGLVKLLKNLEMEVEGLMGFEMAVVTAGGIELKEINPRTMQSKLIDNLYFAGEAIDLDGPTGGYNLQLAWSTGYLAGESAARACL